MKPDYLIKTIKLKNPYDNQLGILRVFKGIKIRRSTLLLNASLIVALYILF